MFLKNYQQKVVKALKDFFTTADNQKETLATTLKAVPEAMRPTINAGFDWVKLSYDDLSVAYNDVSAKTGLSEAYPRFVIKVPTGGGKTLLAVEAIREYQNLFAKRKTGLVVWIVPSETIYTQTIQKLKDRSHFLRQLIDQSSGGNTIIIEKGQKLTQTDLDNNLVILFIMIQSVSRANSKDALKVFQDSGGYDTFFPADNRYDLHKELLAKFPNLDTFDGTGATSVMTQVRTSLGNAIRITQPLILIDEIHKVFSDNARNTINNLNPSMVIGFSATPKPEMNILVSITGLELKEEEMVKLDLHINPPTSRVENDWKAMLKEIVAHRKKLEKEAIKLQTEKGTYIRPIALIQVERTGKDQRTGEYVHSLDVRDELLQLGISADEIAIKTSSQNDIEDVDLLSRNTPIRYIITKDALREGWDCSYAYILGIIPNVGSNTGITQLVGRVLRQPYAKKTGVEQLDESYVYFVKGGVQEMLGQVTAGFKSEGLEDLTNTLKVAKNAAVNPAKTVKIKPSIAKQFRQAFFMPVWICVTDKKKLRPFCYEIDILPRLDFSAYTLQLPLLDKIKNALSTETLEHTSYVVTLNQQSRATTASESVSIEQSEAINLNHFTRRVTDVVENPFLARKMVNSFIPVLENHLGTTELSAHFGFIVSEVFKDLNAERINQEEKIFNDLITGKDLELAVSDHQEIGYHIPTTDTIYFNGVPNAFNHYLYDDFDPTTLNSLERTVADTLDTQTKILWWFRNKVSRGWYAIQGWKRHKIRPDFIAAKKKDDGSLEFMYVIESKGEHLAGNTDSQYKKKVMDTMTNQKVTVYQQELSFGVLNEDYAFYFVEQGNEVADLKTMMK